MIVNKLKVTQPYTAGSTASSVIREIIKALCMKLQSIIKRGNQTDLSLFWPN